MTNVFWQITCRTVDFFTVHTIWFETTGDASCISSDTEWTAQQIVEAFAFEIAPKYLLRDCEFLKQLEDMDIDEVLSAPDLPGNGFTSNA